MKYELGEYMAVYPELSGGDEEVLRLRPNSDGLTNRDKPGLSV